MILGDDYSTVIHAGGDDVLGGGGSGGGGSFNDIVSGNAPDIGKLTGMIEKYGMMAATMALTTAKMNLTKGAATDTKTVSQS